MKCLCEEGETLNKPSSNRSPRFPLPNEQLEIPILKEIAELVDYNYELTVLLNQLYYAKQHGINELSINLIRKSTLSDRADQTLRNYLSKLIELGYVKSRKSSRYQCIMYSVTDKLQLTGDGEALAFVYSKDLKDESCYVTAALLNKFEMMAKDGRKEVLLSASYVKELLQTSLQRGKIRLILKNLVNKRYLKERLDGRYMVYELEHRMLLGRHDEESIRELATDLASKYKKIITTIHGETSNKDVKHVFIKLLHEGYDYSTLRHILAYIGDTKTKINLDKLQESAYYEALYTNAYVSISRRRGNRFLFKLENGYLKPKEHVKREKIRIKKTDTLDAELWVNADEWIKKNSGILYNLYSKQSGGVFDVDFEDYKQVALIEIFNILYGGGYITIDLLQKRLSTYMKSKRPLTSYSESELEELRKEHDENKKCNPSIKDFEIDKHSKLLYQSSFETIMSPNNEKPSEQLKLLNQKDLYDYLCTEDVENDKKTEQNMQTAGQILAAVQEIISNNKRKFKCNPLILEQFKDYHGYDYRDYSYEELATKYSAFYDVSKSTINSHIRFILDELSKYNIKPPPDY